MSVQAQKSGRRARKRPLVGDGIIAQVERDQDVRQLVAAEAKDRTADHRTKLLRRRISSPRSVASSLVTTWMIGLLQKPRSHGRNSNRARLNPGRTVKHPV